MSLIGKHIVKIGDSIRNKQKSNLVTFQYDFVPGTVVNNQPGEVKIDNENCISVDLPNKSGISTQFKGSIKEAVKECVLIYNKKTGEWTLERLDYTVSLKNTRKPGSMVIPEPQKHANLSDSSDDERPTKETKSKTKQNHTDIFGDYSDSDKEGSQNVSQTVLDELNLTDSDLDDVEENSKDKVEDMVIDGGCEGFENPAEEDLQLTDSSSNNSSSSSSSSSSDSDSESAAGSEPDDQSYVSN